MNKKGQGLVTGIVLGIAALVLGVIVSYVVISTLLDADLFPSPVGNNSEFNDTASSLSGNFTTGVNNISSKIPTILLIAAVVLLFGVIVLLVAASKRMGLGSSGSL